MENRFVVKDEVLASFVDALQAINAGVYLGLGVALTTEKYQEKGDWTTEYRVVLYTDHKAKDKREAVTAPQGYEIDTPQSAIHELGRATNGYI